MTIVLLMSTALLCVVGMLALALVVEGQHRRYLALQRIDRTRTHFANIRIRAMELVREGKLDSDSMTFQYLYLIPTYVMRRPDKYPEVAADLIRALGNRAAPTSGAKRFQKEAKDWSPEIRDLSKSLAEGMFLLILDYSALVRWLVRVHRCVASAAKVIHVLKGLVEPLARLESATMRALERKVVVIGEFRQAQDCLRVAA